MTKMTTLTNISDTEVLNYAREMFQSAVHDGVLKGKRVPLSIALLTTRDKIHAIHIDGNLEKIVETFRGLSRLARVLHEMGLIRAVFTVATADMAVGTELEKKSVEEIANDKANLTPCVILTVSTSEGHTWLLLQPYEQDEVTGEVTLLGESTELETNEHGKLVCNFIEEWWK